MRKNGCIIFLLLSSFFLTCNKKSPTEANEITTLQFNSNYIFYVDRIADHPDVQFPMDTLTEGQYKPINGGKSYDVKFSSNGESVYINSDSLIGSLNAETSLKRKYNLTKGLFGGGRFIVWAQDESLYAELTIYGSGVPIILSERGKLLKR
jgi:hypothetical protein